MEDTNMSKGIEVFNEFVNKIPEGISNFDYFVLLDYLSQKRIDKDAVKSEEYKDVKRTFIRGSLKDEEEK